MLSAPAADDIVAAIRDIGIRRHFDGGDLLRRGITRPVLEQLHDRARREARGDPAGLLASWLANDALDLGEILAGSRVRDHDHGAELRRRDMLDFTRDREVERQEAALELVLHRSGSLDLREQAARRGVQVVDVLAEEMGLTGVEIVEAAREAATTRECGEALERALALSSGRRRRRAS